MNSCCSVFPPSISPIPPTGSQWRFVCWSVFPSHPFPHLSHNNGDWGGGCWTNIDMMASFRTHACKQSKGSWVVSQSVECMKTIESMHKQNWNKSEFMFFSFRSLSQPFPHLSQSWSVSPSHPFRHPVSLAIVAQLFSFPSPSQPFPHLSHNGDCCSVFPPHLSHSPICLKMAI